MISTPGPMELLLILGLALLVLGPNRLPSAARSAGKAVRDFRDALSGGDRDEEDEFAADDEELVAAGPAPEAEHRERAAGGVLGAGVPGRRGGRDRERAAGRWRRPQGRRPRRRGRVPRAQERQRH